MIGHYPERPVQWADGRQIRAIWSRNPGGKAIVFIHGYGGNPVSTWADFHELLPAQPKTAEYDLIFYDYDGLRADMTTSSDIFREFLVALFARPAALVNSSLPVSAARAGIFEYTEVVIVAHSLGAVISRWAILQAREAQCAWTSRLKLVFFAPAHMGANVVRLALSVISGFPYFAALAGIWRFESPLVDQLKTNSPELKELRARTKKAIADGNSNYLIAKKTIHAEHEKIVSNLQFCSDPPAVPFGGDHFSICKPKQRFPDPVNQLLEIL